MVDSPVLSAYKILIVDDDEDNRQLVAVVLKLAGARVTQASSANEAYDLVANTEFDLLISDIAMPTMDGCELVRKVLAGSAHPPLAVALSGHARDEDVARSLVAGFDSHLVKPVAPGELIAHLLARLRKRTPST